MARSPSAEYLILDIETIPDTERWARPETPHGESAFPPTWAHRIIVVGYLWLDHGYRLKRFGVIGENTAEAGTNGGGPGSAVTSADVAASGTAATGSGGTAATGSGSTATSGSGSTAASGSGSTLDDRERRLLAELSQFVGRARPVLVTYNGRSFDLPVVVMRSLCHAIALPWYYRDRDIRHRYSEAGHLDLCDWLADHGATRASKLDAVARLIGLPGKVGVDGSQVEGLYQAGQLASIQQYCLADVAQTALLLLRFRLLQGQLAPEVYRDRTAALLDGLAADGRVSGMLDKLDRERLLGGLGAP